MVPECLQGSITVTRSQHELGAPGAPEPGRSAEEALRLQKTWQYRTLGSDSTCYCTDSVRAVHGVQGICTLYVFVYVLDGSVVRIYVNPRDRKDIIMLCYAMLACNYIDPMPYTSIRMHLA
jgi:hypothetical protein